jgi:hypothetical protein
MDTRIRRDNLRTAWRLRWEFTADEQAQLEELCGREWGANWREAVEAN